MRTVAGKDHPAVHETRHAPALKGVEAVPLRSERHALPQQAAYQRFDLARIDACRAIIPAELKIESPQVIRLLVQQRRLARVERRIEPEPTLGRSGSRHPDIGDQKAILELPPLKCQSQRRSY